MLAHSHFTVVIDEDTYLAFISFVRSSSKDNHNQINDDRTANCHKHCNIAGFSKVTKFSKNFVKVNWVWCLNEVSSKCSQMITATNEVC